MGSDRTRERLDPDRTRVARMPHSFPTGPPLRPGECRSHGPAPRVAALGDRPTFIGGVCGLSTSSTASTAAGRGRAGPSILRRLPKGDDEGQCRAHDLDRPRPLPRVRAVVGRAVGALADVPERRESAHPAHVLPRLRAAGVRLKREALGLRRAACEVRGTPRGTQRARNSLVADDCCTVILAAQEPEREQPRPRQA